jgi:N-acetylmuramoyl-L-alanine amidase
MLERALRSFTATALALAALYLLAGPAYASELGDPASAAGPLRSLPRTAPVGSGAVVKPLVMDSSGRTPLVTIDAGHGGPYNNASYGSLREKNVNLSLALDLRQVLLARGYRVTMTRSSDRAVSLADIPTWHWLSSVGRWSWYADRTTRYSVPYDDLQGRCDAARVEGADLFISIHNNGVSSSGANGTETFAASDDALGQRVASYVQAEVVSATGMRDRGAKVNDFYVVRWSDMPALLVEGGFITNAHDRAILTSRSGRAALVGGIARGIDRFFAAKPLAPYWVRTDRADSGALAAAIARQSDPATSTAVFIVQDGSFYDLLAVAPLARKLRAPVLVTAGSRIPSATFEELVRLHPGRIVLLGASAGLTTPTVDALAGAAGLASEDVTRLAGADRYGTAVAVARELGPTSGRICVVSGRAPSDAAAITPYCASKGIPLLFSDPLGMPAATKGFIAERRAGIASVLVVGGVGAVPAAGVAGLPGVMRIAGADSAQTAVRVLDATHGTRVSLNMADSTRWMDTALAALSAARAGRHLMLAGAEQVSPRWREWFENHGNILAEVRTFGTGGHPASRFDHAIRKARY